MKKRQIVCALLASAAITACGNEKTAVPAEKYLGDYPIETDETLTYWITLPTNISSVTDNFAKTEYCMELERRTGIKVKFSHPVAGQEKETLGLMIASDDLPDIIDTNWISYSGGPEKAMKEKVISDISAYKEYAPNFFKFLADNPEYDRAAKTDDGRYYGFVMVNDGSKLLMPSGPAIRMDWLRDLGLETPETVDEWTNMLRAFKDEKGATAPFSFDYGTISCVMSMFEAKYDPYIKDGKIVYGPAQPEFKRGLETLSAWFEEGLLDKNIVSVDKKVIDGQILAGKTGATMTAGGSGVGQYAEAMRETDPDFDLAGVQYPTYTKGKAPYTLPIMLPVAGGAAAITPSSKNPELAAKYLDYVYSEEGHMFANFGIEGKTYNIVDGEPKYSDLIINNPDGLSMAQALGKYVKAGSGTAFVQDERYIIQYYHLPQQQEALKNWNIGAEASMEITSPPLTLTEEESSEYSTIINDVTKYRNQMIVKFITGIEPIENFDGYVETMNQMGLDRAMEIRSAALNRYYSK